MSLNILTKDQVSKDQLILCKRSSVDHKSKWIVDSVVERNTLNTLIVLHVIGLQISCI